MSGGRLIISRPGSPVARPAGIETNVDEQYVAAAGPCAAQAVAPAGAANEHCIGASR